MADQLAPSTVGEAAQDPAVTGGDPAAYQTCHSVFPCGSHYGQEVGVDAMRGDVEKASAMLRASGRTIRST